MYTFFDIFKTFRIPIEVELVCRTMRIGLTVPVMDISGLYQINGEVFILPLEVATNTSGNGSSCNCTSSYTHQHWLKYQYYYPIGSICIFFVTNVILSHIHVLFGIKFQKASVSTNRPILVTSPESVATPVPTVRHVSPTQSDSKFTTFIFRVLARSPPRCSMSLLKGSPALFPLRMRKGSRFETKIPFLF